MSALKTERAWTKLTVLAVKPARAWYIDQIHCVWYRFKNSKFHKECWLTWPFVTHKFWSFWKPTIRSIVQPKRLNFTSCYNLNLWSYPLSTTMPLFSKAICKSLQAVMSTKILSREGYSGFHATGMTVGFVRFKFWIPGFSGEENYFCSGLI